MTADKSILSNPLRLQTTEPVNKTELVDGYLLQSSGSSDPSGQSTTPSQTADIWTHRFRVEHLTIPSGQVIGAERLINKQHGTTKTFDLETDL